MVPDDRPVPEPAAPRRKVTPARAVWAVFLGGLLVALLAFLISGTLLTVGIFVLPVLAVGAVLYLVWSTRRRADRGTGLRENSDGTGTASVGPRGGPNG